MIIEYPKITKPVKKQNYKRVSNKVKSYWSKLLKDGYYLKPCIYDNITIYEIVKDVHSADFHPTRICKGSMNQITARYLETYFNFKTKGHTEYFGKVKPIKNYIIEYTSHIKI